MTTLNDRPNTALVIIDVQNGVVKEAHDRDAIIGNMASAVDKARAAKVPVIWVQHINEGLVKDSEAWRIVPELVPAAGEAVVEKFYGDAFEETVLEALLANLHVGRLVIAGAQTDACIRSSLHGAFTRGYDVTLVGDGHTTDDMSRWGAPPPGQVIAHTNLYWAHQTAPGRKAGVVKTEALAFDAA
jgi:nicotinamidase-related amidase